jgi:hypothetical protein
MSLVGPSGEENSSLLSPSGQKMSAGRNRNFPARVVSASQFGAGMWLEACPDAYKKTGVTLPTAKKTLRKLARGPVSVFLMAEYDGKW